VGSAGREETSGLNDSIPIAPEHVEGCGNGAERGVSARGNVTVPLDDKRFRT